MLGIYKSNFFFKNLDFSDRHGILTLKYKINSMDVVPIVEKHFLVRYE